MKTIVNYSDIIKRQNVLSENYHEDNSKSCKIYLDRVHKNSDRSAALRFIKECGSSVNSIVPYFIDCIEVLEEQYSTNPHPSNMKELEDAFCNEVVSRLPNINKSYTRNDMIRLESSVINSNLPQVLKDRVKDKITKNKISDRIIENHNIISQNFDISSYISKFKFNKCDKNILIERVCSLVDQFDSKLYAKVNTAIEETVYLFQKEDIVYDEREIVNTITEYFMIDNITPYDVSNIYKVVTENHCIDVVGVGKEKTYDELIKDYISTPHKNPEKFHNLIESVLNLNTIDIIKGFPSLLGIFETMIIKENELVPVLLDPITISEIYDSIRTRINEPYYRDLLTSISESINNVVKQDTIPLQEFGDNIVINMNKYNDRLIGLKESIDNELDIVYPYSNIENMVENCDTVISLYEFSFFKFNNILNTAWKIDRFLAEKIKGLKNKTKGKIKGVKGKIKELLGIKESVYDMITAEHYIDYCASIIEMDTTGDMSDCYKVLEETCDYINRYIAEDDMRVYYIIHPGKVEIHLKENCKVNLNKEESEEIEDNKSEDIIEGFVESMYNKDIMMGIDPKPINDIIEEAVVLFSRNNDATLFNFFVEACEVLGLEQSTVKEMAERIYNNCGNIDDITEFSLKASSSIINYEACENTPFNICMEAYSIMDSILEDAKRSNDNNKDKEEKLKETNKKVDKLKQNKEEIDKDDNKRKENDTKEKKKVDPATNIKLYFQGLKKSVKDLGSKGKQLTNNANAAFDRLARACKDALVSDRREAIIKGSVIPSFSKSCKLAVGLAGIAKFASPATALVTAIGGLVASKSLTRKERALLLDEIDVELEMIEKEIQLAESKNQLKKLRKLMLIKKDLQREYQRIKLNIRIGKDVIPGATAGRKQYDK